MQRLIRNCGVGILLALNVAAAAETPADFLARFQNEVRQTDSNFAASAARGQQFFNSVHANDWSCSSCHTKNPAAQGRHAKTGKVIEPLAPSANAGRFTNNRTVEKWFRRNCGDVLGRTCSPVEKADVLAYLMSVKP
jgi:mono/diheme cytochrome c family protein